MSTSQRQLVLDGKIDNVSFDEKIVAIGPFRDDTFQNKNNFYVCVLALMFLPLLSLSRSSFQTLFLTLLSVVLFKIPVSCPSRQCFKAS